MYFCFSFIEGKTPKKKEIKGSRKLRKNLKKNLSILIQIKKIRNKKILKNVLIICLISIFCAGCATFNGKEQWSSVVKPVPKDVIIIPIPEAKIEESGFYMSRKDAYNLVNNVDELKAYVEKLEIQVKQMKKYYGDK